LRGQRHVADLVQEERAAVGGLEVADAALFLVSPLSKHITGQTLVIDGGWTSVSPNP